MLVFLILRFNQGAAYDIQNSEKSAISLSSVELDNNLLISRFFKRIFKIQPTKPKYIWSTEAMLKSAEVLKPLESLDLNPLLLS